MITLEKLTLLHFQSLVSKLENAREIRSSILSVELMSLEVE